MSKRGIIQNAIVIVLGLAIIAMSVGYAAFDTSLKIEGSTTFESGSWDVHLENPVKTINSTIESDAIVSAPIVNQAGTEVGFVVNMHAGDVYEFTVDVKNAGTFNAKLANYNLVATQDGINVPIEELSNASMDAKLTYQVIDSKIGEVLNKSAISTKTIRITANANAETSKYEFKFNMTYVQNNQK